jgi:hypothetical protein
MSHSLTRAGVVNGTRFITRSGRCDDAHMGASDDFREQQPSVVEPRQTRGVGEPRSGLATASEDNPRVPRQILSHNCVRNLRTVRREHGAHFQEFIVSQLDGFPIR